MLPVPELLAPAGDLERLEYALRYGADAVYAGLTEFGMRSAPQNFTPEQMAEGAALCHARGKKLYLTLNTLPTNEELKELPEAIRQAWAAGVDAFIVADLGVLSMVKQYAPEAEIHLSTQMGVTNWAAARAAYELGAKRVVLARELTLQQIAEIRANTPEDLELEAFVHGAMCMSVSGRCLLSQYLAGRPVCSALPLEILSDGRDPPRSVHGNRRNARGQLYSERQRPLHRALHRPDLRCRRGQPED